VNISCALGELGILRYCGIVQWAVGLFYWRSYKETLMVVAKGTEIFR
jgi:hypothetical protein